MVDKVATAPVRIRPLVAGAWAEVVRTLSALWPVWLLQWILMVAVGLTFRMLRPAGASSGEALDEQLATLACELLVDGGAVALAMPVLMRMRSHPWRFDRRQAGYATAWLLVQGVASLVLVLAMAAVPPTSGASLGIGILGFVAFTWVTSRLLLWPLSLLTADQRLTPAASWRAMSGAVWPYLAADLAGGLVPTLLWLFLNAQFDAYGYLVSLGLGVLALGISNVWSMAVAARVFHRRLGGDARDLGAVFA